MECSKFCFKKQIPITLTTHVRFLNTLCASSQVTEYPFKIQTFFEIPAEILVFNDDTTPLFKGYFLKCQPIFNPRFYCISIE